MAQFTVKDIAGVACFGSKEIEHLGIFYHDDGEVLEAQVEWHERLTFGPIACPSDFELWARPRLDPAKVELIAFSCRLIRSVFRKRRFPYGFSCPKGAFTESGDLSEGTVGLTCASFVLAVLDLVGEPLLVYDTWPNRPTDDEKQRATAAAFLKDGADAAQVQAMLAELPKPRFQPDEVMGAILAPTPPVIFGSHEQLCKEITQKMMSLKGQANPALCPVKLKSEYADPAQ